MVPPKNPRSSERGFFYPLRKQWYIINDSIAIVVSHQSVRTVYHHAKRVSKNFRNDDIQLPQKLMICNSCGLDDIQCSALIYFRFCAIIHTGGDEMKKFMTIGYRKGKALIGTNGGTLIITDREYIVKYLFFIVAKYEINKTVASKISFVSKGINLNDGEKEIDIYFFSKTAQKVYELLNLK